MFKKNQVIITQNGKEQIVEKLDKIGGGNIRLIVKGENNQIKIGQDCKFNNVIIAIVGNGAHISISHRCNLNNLRIDVGSGQGQHLEIGYNCTFFGGRIVLRDSSHIKINDHCLFGEGLQIWATDAHTIFDATTHKLLNPTPDKLEIGKHCWIGGDVHILKNGSLPDETVVGMCSVVTKTFTEPHTIIGGYPAKVLKRGISWSRETIPNWLKNNNQENKL